MIYKLWISYTKNFRPQSGKKLEIYFVRRNGTVKNLTTLYMYCLFKSKVGEREEERERESGEKLSTPVWEVAEQEAEDACDYE